MLSTAFKQLEKQEEFTGAAAEEFVRVLLHKHMSWLKLLRCEKKGRKSCLHNNFPC